MLDDDVQEPQSGALFIIFLPYINWTVERGHPSFSHNFESERAELNALIDKLKDKCACWCLVLGASINMYTHNLRRLPLCQHLQRLPLMRCLRRSSQRTVAFLLIRLMMSPRRIGV